MGAAKAQQIDFSGILVSAGAGTQVTLTLPTTSENAEETSLFLLALL